MIIKYNCITAKFQLSLFYSINYASFVIIYSLLVDYIL